MLFDLVFSFFCEQFLNVAAHCTAGSSRAMPGFDVIDYGQKDYVFDTAEQDAGHWDRVLLGIFETYADVLAPLFNSSSSFQTVGLKYILSSFAPCMETIPYRGRCLHWGAV